MKCHYLFSNHFLICPRNHSSLKVYEDSILASKKCSICLLCYFWRTQKEAVEGFCGEIAKLRTVCPVVKCGVWTVRGPELTWIMFQVGLGCAVAAAGAGSRLWFAETTSQATGTHSVALHTGESVQTTLAASDVWWGFPRSGWNSRSWITVNGNILSYLLLSEGDWEYKCSLFKQ